MRIGEKGEVWFAFDEQGKSRPYVIVSNGDIVAEIDHVVVKVTSQSPRNKFDVTLEEWKQAGLNRESIVRCSKLRTMHYKLLDFKVGELTEPDLKRVMEALQDYFS